MTASWVSEPILSLDIESSGVDCWSDRIVEVAAATVLPDGTVADSYRTVVDPGVEIPDEAAAIHGITTERARAEGVSPAEAVSEIARRLFEHGFRPVVAYNATFDWPFFIAEAERYGLEFPCISPVLDPFLIDKLVDRYRKGSRKLVDVAKHYGVPLDEAEAHGALADCVAAGRVMRVLLERFPEIGKHPLASVYVRQVRGHENWRLGFNEYKQRQDPSFYVAPGWPIPTDGVPAPLALVKQDKGSGEAGDREVPGSSVSTAATSPDVPAAPAAAEGPASPAEGGATGEVAAGLSHDTAATEPVPIVTASDVGKLGTKVFRPMVEGGPGVTARVERLRHALCLAATKDKRSLTDCSVDELRRVRQRLVDIESGALVVEVLEDGVSFEYPGADHVEGGTGAVVLWSQLETADAVAAS